MKKFLSIFLTMAVFVATTFCFYEVSFASTPKGRQLGDSDVYYNYTSTDKTLTISGQGDMPKMSNSTADIPWLDTGWDIQKIVIEEGVTSVGNYAFYRYSADVVLPSTLTKIGKYSFASNNLITSIHLPLSLESIDTRAFDSCSNLQSVTFNASIKTVGTYCFNNCVNLNEVKFENLAQDVSFSSYAFLNCKSLNFVSFPENASLSTCSYGYISSKVKNENATMQVFPDSKAYYYAVANDIPYTIKDDIELQCGIKSDNSFNDSNKTAEIHFTFTPKTAQGYVLYSFGNCDVYARLEKDGNTLATSYDVDKSNSGFSIKYEMTAGQTYDLFVGSEKMTGDYSVLVLPSEIKAFSVTNGNVNKIASDYSVYDEKKIFTITNDDISNFDFKIEFADGTSYTTPYCRFIAGEYVSILDTIETQKIKEFSCGHNEGRLGLGNSVATYSINIEHSFTEKVIAPTEDEDGYTLHTCVLCTESFKSDFVKTSAYKVVGNVYLSEHPLLDTYESKVPYHSAIVSIDKREYAINLDGTFELHTFNDCYAVFNNPYGGNVTVKVEVKNAVDGIIDIGDIVLSGYDLNKDGYVNAKDYVIYRKEKIDDLGENYWQFADEFLIKY